MPERFGTAALRAPSPSRPAQFIRKGADSKTQGRCSVLEWSVFCSGFPFAFPSSLVLLLLVLFFLTYLFTLGGIVGQKTVSALILKYWFFFVVVDHNFFSS